MTRLPEPILVRTYGLAGPTIFVLHGGPGAPGYVTPLARRLSEEFTVLEPFQRPSGPAPLTVASHVADLHQLIDGHRRRPALVGHSWGAMLALAYAAAHPDQAGPLALIGCGTFDLAARERFKAIIKERTDGDEELRRRLERLPEEFPDPARQLAARGKLMDRLYACDPIESDEDSGGGCDARANRETWDDMLRCQAAGLYPAAFSAICSPVLMLHGAADPHPGRMIRDGLAPFLPQLEYHELARCGHSPWLERAAREEFFATLSAWLRRHTDGR